MITKTGQSSYKPPQRPQPRFAGGLLADKSKLATYMGILMPNVFVAPMRYFVMRENPDVKYRLFMRDVLSAAAGVGTFYAAMLAAKPLLARTVMKAKPIEDIKLAATFAGWVANVIVQGYGAVRMSEWMSERQQEKQGKTIPAENNLPDKPSFPAMAQIAASPPRVASPLPRLVSPTLENQRYFRSPQFIPPVIPQFSPPVQFPPPNPFVLPG